MTIWTATAYPMPSSRAARFRPALTVSMAILTDHPRNIVLGIPGRATALKAISDQLLPWNSIQPVSEGFLSRFIHRLPV